MDQLGSAERAGWGPDEPVDGLPDLRRKRIGNRIKNVETVP
ncbi:MAG TPA: hypothetical protein PKA19_15480 [Bacillota bacterium]|nr:hypothetical protein [Bacillota bacterium]